jgi:4-hydroxybenzoate polyprenyltransferase
MQIRERLPQYVSLLRLDKPIGILLLLWPTLWALWLASSGHPHPLVLFIFVTGTILMRSAGCVVNDLADRHIDGHVERTRKRPLANGQVSVLEASAIATILSACAFLLVLFCNSLTVSLAVIGALFVVIYPLLKRVTHLPQLGLGVAFSWGVPMAFAAQTGTVTLQAWFLFLASLTWPVIYDTMYAMVDKADDVKIGVKSTAILFGSLDRVIIGLLQLLFIIMFVIVGLMFRLQAVYYAALFIVIGLFIYQQWLIKNPLPQRCFHAFLNNNLVGLVIFAGILLSYLP